MIEENEILGALKELYRREKTQKALAELAGITQSTINAYFSGKAKIENMPVGVFLKLFRNMKINYQSLKKTINNQALSVMGVDTEEEAMDLMKYQQAYNLNSKMMSVMNELYDRLINQTGL